MPVWKSNECIWMDLASHKGMPFVGLYESHQICALPFLVELFLILEKKKEKRGGHRSRVVVGLKDINAVTFCGRSLFWYFKTCNNSNASNNYLFQRLERGSQEVSFPLKRYKKIFRTSANVDWVTKHFIKPSLISYCFLKFTFLHFPMLVLEWKLLNEKDLLFLFVWKTWKDSFLKKELFERCCLNFEVK